MGAGRGVGQGNIQASAVASLESIASQSKPSQLLTSKTSWLEMRRSLEILTGYCV